MDPLSQSLFGALVGQAGFGRQIGSRAAVAGAAIAIAPDLDIFWPYGDELAAWVYHRGITHSLIAGPFLGAGLGWLFWLWWRWRERPAPLAPCLWLGIIAFTSHAGLDLFTTYGTQLLAPFAATRFAVPALPVIDLTYTLVLLLGVIAAFIFHARPNGAQAAAGGAIMLSIIWQFYGWHIQLEAKQLAHAQLEAEHGIRAAHIEAWPLLFQPWARRIAAETEQGFYIALWSPLTGEKPVWQHYDRQAHPFAAHIVNHASFRLFHRFTSGHLFWRVRPMPNGEVRIEAHDMRYMNGNMEAMESLWALGARFSATGELLDAPHLVFYDGDRAGFIARLREITFGAAP